MTVPVVVGCVVKTGAVDRVTDIPSAIDLIVAIDDRPVASFDDVLIYLERYTAPGTEVVLTVLRDGEEVEISLTLGKRPG